MVIEQYPDEAIGDAISRAVLLDWEKRGQLTLTQSTESNGTAVLRVPVEIHGHPPVIAFNPRYLADALEIGSTLCLGTASRPESQTS